MHMDELPQETDATKDKVVQFYLATGHQQSLPTDYYILWAVVSHISIHEAHIVVVIRKRKKNRSYFHTTGFTLWVWLIILMYVKYVTDCNKGKRGYAPFLATP